MVNPDTFQDDNAKCGTSSGGHKSNFLPFFFC